MNIGKSIRKAMIDKDMTNAQFAKLYGVTESHASRMKKCADISGGSIKKLADVFEMSASEFIALGE